MEYVSVDGDSETSSLSDAYHKSISSNIDFIRLLIVVSRIFALTKPSTESLQSPMCDRVQCYEMVEELALYFTELMNDDHMDKLHDHLTQFETRHDIPFKRASKKITSRAFFESIYQVLYQVQSMN